MRDEHLLAAGLGDCPVQAGPVGVVRQDEAPLDALAAASAAKHHPTAGERGRDVAELAEPGRAERRRRGDDHAAGPGALLLPLAAGAAGVVRLRQRDAGLTVAGVAGLHRPVAVDLTDRGIEPGDHPLALAERVGEHARGAAEFGVLPPPAVDLGVDRLLRRPAVDRQPERRLGDERMAGDRLERGAGVVGAGGLVVAGGDPDLAVDLDPDLGRTENVPGRVQRDLRPPDRVRLAVVPGLDDGVGPHAGLQHMPARRGREIPLGAAAGMVGVGMRDDRAVDRPPGVDVEVAGLAVEPGVVQLQDIGHA